MIGLGGFLSQLVVVAIGFIVAGSNLTSRSTDGVSVGGSLAKLGWLLLAIAVLAIIVAAVRRIPMLRRLYERQVRPQLSAGIANFKAVLRTPKKAVQLLGGQLLAQVLFAIAFGAALHAFGYNLSLIELMTINCLASFIGGIMPVPGGLGVVETGLIAGLTAFGIPQEAAVATTFLYRLCTSYLPPIWGWLALRWLHQRDYV
jgi:uncharacterized protein (TIRG00374 family)